MKSCSAFTLHGFNYSEEFQIITRPIYSGKIRCSFISSLQLNSLVLYEQNTHNGLLTANNVVFVQNSNISALFIFHKL
jgi:hypothetical protein